MTIERSSGKNIEIFEEYELYTRDYKENVQGKSSFIAKGGTLYGDSPEAAKPLEITNLYVKVRLAGAYNGEFGFDWVDVNPETNEIEKIQDVPFADVEYFYKKGATTDDLGDIVESSDKMGAKHAIQDHYKINSISKFIDLPYVLIKPGQEITLSAEIILWQGEINNDVIAITGDEFYNLELNGVENEGKTAKLTLTKAGKIKFKIKCLKAGGGQKYEFEHTNAQGICNLVGGVYMMENKVLNLKFRVIALVSSEDDPNEKAKVLFKKFKDAGIKDYLNKNSLNQAGYEVEIENFNEMDNADVDDYFYAFDKEDWTNRKFFSVDNGRLRYFVKKNKDGVLDTFNEVQEGQIGDFIEEDGLDKNGNKKYKISQKNEIDKIVINEYKNKLKGKSKSYENGGIIILSDLECTDPSTDAFSKINPIDYYSLFCFSNVINSKDTYAHEIGHMLGLEHTFCDENITNKKSKIDIYAKDPIQKCMENIDQEKSENQISTVNKNLKPKKDQIKKITTFSSYTVLKSTLLKCIANSNEFLIEREKFYSNKVLYYTNIANDKSPKSQYKIGNDVVSRSKFDKVVQDELNTSQNEKKRFENYRLENNNAVSQLNKITSNAIFNFEFKFNLIYEDSLSIYNDNWNSKLEDWRNTIKNYLYFYEKSTKNTMDYGQIINSNGDTVKKLNFLSHQIIIMRNDYENYK